MSPHSNGCDCVDLFYIFSIFSTQRTILLGAGSDNVPDVHYFEMTLTYFYIFSMSGTRRTISLGAGPRQCS